MKVRGRPFFFLSQLILAMNSFSNPILGLDIGGTNIKAGVYVDGALLDVRIVPTPAQESQEKVLETIAELISGYVVYGFHAIGIGIPGLIDVGRGVVLNLSNIPSFQKVCLKDYLQGRFQKPVFVNNDANCFVLGEYKFGEAKVYRHVVGLTLGTGLGGGIMANGQLYCGVLAGAGEWCGLSYLDRDFEYYCSGKFFQGNYGKKAKVLVKLAKGGDQEALGAFEAYGSHLGELIKNILYTLAPEAVVLGGSIRKAYPYFKDSLHRQLETFQYKPVSDSFKLLISELDEAGIHGAVALAAEQVALENVCG